MARVFTDGAEMGDTLFWSSSANVSAVTANPVPQYSAYCYKLGYFNSAVKLLPTALSEGYLRARVYFYNVNYTFVRFCIGSQYLLTLWGDSGFVAAGTPLGSTTSATPIVTGQWYLFEVYFKIADAPNGRYTVYQDGVQIIDFTGDTLYLSYTTFDNITFATYYNTVELAIDDLAFNDTTGGSDDSYCGDGVIIKVTPDGAGAHNNWHGSDGNDVDNWLLVDEYPHDSDTTYVYHDGASSGTQEQYALSDYDGTDKTITRVYPEARIRKTAAAAHTVKLGILASGGADEMSAAMNLSMAYQRFVGDEYTVNPVDSNPWEEADIDALEFVAEVG